MKKLILAIGAVTLAGCSNVTEIPERETYAQPDWYIECVSSGTEGYFWNSKEFAYACGTGESRHQQAAEEQAYAFAMNSFAKRINGVVNSKTELNYENDKRQSKTSVSYHVKDTTIRSHIDVEKVTFIYQGKRHFFVKLKKPKNVFDALSEENRE